MKFISGKALKEWSLVIIIAITAQMLVILTKVWILAPYKMMTEDMKPAIQKGEYIIALKIGQTNINDIVVASCPESTDEKKCLSRITGIEDNIVILKCDNPDCKKYMVSKKDITGRIIF